MNHDSSPVTAQEQLAIHLHDDDPTNHLIKVRVGSKHRHRCGGERQTEGRSELFIHLAYTTPGVRKGLI